MAKSQALNVTQNIKTPGVSFVNADGVANKTLVTAGANDSVVKSIMVTSSDTAVVNLKVSVGDGVTDRVIGTVAVPIASGTNGAAASVDLLNAASLPGLPLDQNGKRILPLQTGYLVKVAPLVALTAAKNVDVVAVVEDY
jgi:hypothetical protein